MKNKPLFVILGAGGYPYKVSAAGNKYFLVSKALYARNFDAQLINKYNISSNVINSEGTLEGVKYCYLAGSRKRNQAHLKFIGEVIANIKLLFFLRTHSSTYRKKYLVISYSSLFSIIFYWVLAKIYDYRLLFSIMEDPLSLNNKLLNRISALLFWNFGISLADAFLPISTYLENRVRRRNKDVPIFKIPVLADFDHIAFKEINKKQKFFLYCGGIGYSEVIELIIQAFNNLSRGDINLILILHGNGTKISKIKENVNSFLNIKILTNISQHELYSLFCSSIGLLIPLRPCRQDLARFPQKIAEYLASGTPIITNNIGEITFYFTSGVDMLFAKDYSIEAFTEAMRFVLDNPAQAEKVGINGKELGYKYFHYKNISSDFSDFLLNI